MTGVLTTADAGTLKLWGQKERAGCFKVDFKSRGWEKHDKKSAWLIHVI